MNQRLRNRFFDRRAGAYAAVTFGLVFCLGWIPAGTSLSRAQETADVIVYGGTSGGIAAAIQVKRMGRSVILIEPSGHLGGLTTGGLGQTDIGNKAAIGGLAREFYRRVRRYYEREEAWKWQARNDYRSIGQSASTAEEDTMWTFEPHVALQIYQQWLSELEIPVVMNERLTRETGVSLTRSQPHRILAIQTESGRTYRGQMFIDATYEGDLMASAGVRCIVGREANDVYGETLNGVQTQRAIHHQFVSGVDPFRVPGDRTSGLLPFIEATQPEPDGSGDHRLQAYCFRMCMTDHPENRLPWPKPVDYQEAWYELLLRNFEAGERRVPLSIGLMPNRKTDTNNNFGFSTDFIGQNYDYPEASYQRRDEIVAQHRLYQQGLMWTLANHPRVPVEIRDEVSRWGMCRDEFVAGQGWQDQLYIREARRMVSDLVMTQHHCQGRQVAEDPVGLAAYTMDSHHVQRHVDSDGFVRNEGDVQVGGFSPYGIGYRAIVPRADQCSNLLVPVCLSSSHIAFGSIRMEPVFMVLGQSAATAAVLAIQQDVAVQDLETGQLRARLLADGTILEWTRDASSSVTSGVRREQLAGIVIDDQHAKLTGFDTISTSTPKFVGEGYRHDGNTGKGQQVARFVFRVQEPGDYEIRMSYSPHPNRATNLPVTVQHALGETQVNKQDKGLEAVRPRIGQPFPMPLEQMFSGANPDDEKQLSAIEISWTDELAFGNAALEHYLADLKKRRIRVQQRGEDVDYLKKLVESLRPQMRRAKRYKAIKIFVADTPIIDARCFPGGSLIFFRGMLDAAESEAALAVVVGHELSHLDNSHQLLPLKQSKLIQESFGNPAQDFSPDKFFATGMTLMRVNSRPFRPQDESQADRDGATWAYRAGYDIREMSRLFHRMAAQDPKANNPWAAFVATHPLATNRAQAVLDLYGELQATEPRRDLEPAAENLRRRIPLSEKRFAKQLPD